MSGKLRCPYCGCSVWSTDEGARCTDPDNADGTTTDSRSCDATWDCVGVLQTPPREEMWTMRKFELVTADDQPRGEIRGNRASAVAAAKAITERTGEKVFTQPADAKFVPAGGRK